MQVDRLERGFCYSYGMLCDSSDTNDAFFFFFFLGGKDIRYTSATITTSKKCDVHCKTNKAEANSTS